MPITNEDPIFQDYSKEEHELVTQEDFNKFLNSLPRVDGWSTRYLNQYHGFWLPPMMIQQVISRQNKFQTQDSDIFLVTLPKCGTTWLKALVFALVNRNKLSPFSEEHPLLTKNPHHLVPFLEMDHYAAHKDYDVSCTTTRIFGSHLPVRLLPRSVIESTCKLVYICRNPKDVLISHLFFAQQSRVEKGEGSTLSLQEAFDMFCKGLSFGGPFWDHALDCWNTSLEKPDRVLFLTYEELHGDTVPMLRHLADFLGYSFSPEEEDSGMIDAIVKLCSFQSLSKLEVNKSGRTESGIDNKVFFRKGGVGDWKNHLSDEMADQIDILTEKRFQGSGLLEIKSASFSKSIS